MLTIAFPAAAFGTNCYVLAAGEGEECLVVDPGIGVEETLREVLTQHRLRSGRHPIRSSGGTMPVEPAEPRQVDTRARRRSAPPVRSRAPSTSRSDLECPAPRDSD